MKLVPTPASTIHSPSNFPKSPTKNRSRPPSQSMIHSPSNFKNKNRPPSQSLSRISQETIFNKSPDEIKLFFSFDNDSEDQEVGTIFNLKQKNNALKKVYQEVTDIFDKQVKDSRETVWFLKREIDEKITKLSSLKSLNEQLLEEKENYIQLSEENESTEESQFYQIMNKMEIDLQQLQMEFDKKKEIYDQKTKLEEELSIYQKKLYEQRNQQKIERMNRDREIMNEKKQSRDKMLNEISDIQSRLISLSDNQIERTTQLALDEYLDLKEKLSSSNHELELHQQTLGMLKTRTKNFQQSINKIQKEIKENENFLETERKKEELKIIQSSSLIEEEDREIQQIKEELEEKNYRLNSLNQNIFKLHHNIDEITHRINILFNQQDDILLFLLSYQDDLSNQISEEQELPEAEISSTRLDHLQHRLDVLDYIIHILRKNTSLQQSAISHLISTRGSQEKEKEIDEKMKEPSNMNEMNNIIENNLAKDNMPVSKDYLLNTESLEKAISHCPSFPLCHTAVQTSQHTPQLYINLVKQAKNSSETGWGLPATTQPLGEITKIRKSMISRELKSREKSREKLKSQDK